MAENVQNRLICFLDILGFSNMVRNLSQDEIVTKFQNIFTTIYNVEYRKIQREILKKAGDSRNWDECERDLELLEHACSFRSKSALIETKGKLDTFLGFRRTFNYMIVSDSVIIYSEPLGENQNNLEIFREFVYFIKDLIAQAFLQKLLLRGAVSFGEFYVDIENSIYFGKALLDAIKLESFQQWIGCSLCDNLDSIVFQYFNGFSFDPKESSKVGRLAENTGFVINTYPVPLSDGSFSDRYIINWVCNLIGKVSINDHFFDSELTGEPSIDRKYQNTLIYWKWWVSQCEDLLIRVQNTRVNDSLYKGWEGLPHKR